MKGSEKVAIIKMRTEQLTPEVKKLAETHPQLFVMLGDIFELIRICEKAGEL